MTEQSISNMHVLYKTDAHIHVCPHTSFTACSPSYWFSHDVGVSDGWKCFKINPSHVRKLIFLQGFEMIQMYCSTMQQLSLWLIVVLFCYLVLPLNVNVHTFVNRNSAHPQPCTNVGLKCPWTDTNTHQTERLAGPAAAFQRPCLQR